MVKQKNPAIKKLTEIVESNKYDVSLSFDSFLSKASHNPVRTFRNVFQLFYDFIHSSIHVKDSDLPEDPEEIDFINYDCSDLFIEGTVNPFFADRLFANNLVNMTKSFKRSAQQNKLYLFEGPPGSGKSTFLNNLLTKFEKYTATPEGTIYEILWRLDKRALGWKPEKMTKNTSQRLDDFLEIPCPSHDHPILIIPKEYRKDFLEELISDKKFKEKLFNSKEYEWIFKWDACTICDTLYQELLEKLGSPEKVFEMVVARQYKFNKRLGEGISIFNAGDPKPRFDMVHNEDIQKQLVEILGRGTRIKYLFSQYAKTNNGIYALMDIKGYNKQRLSDLHGIISEGVHKVGEIEENVRSLLFGIINPENKEEIQTKEMQSFLDRVDYISIPYVLDYEVEGEIYKNIFGKDIIKKFIPGVFENFAKVIISTRMNEGSLALEEILSPDDYSQYCDMSLLLLKMDLYRGKIPSWLSEEHKKQLTAKKLREILKESKEEGNKGISGRKSIEYFNRFFLAYSSDRRMIDMEMVTSFFNNLRLETGQKLIPMGFLESLKNLYDYGVLQQVKESLYDYNEERVSKDIQNYLHGINFDEDSDKEIVCHYTGESFKPNENFFRIVEDRILGSRIDGSVGRKQFRKEIQSEYVSQTLTREIRIEGKKITETKLYSYLFDAYLSKLKENVLDPFVDNDNFRDALRDYGTREFKTYDKKIQDDITFLLNNLITKYGYTKESARQICLYVMDNGLVTAFKNMDFD